MLVVTSRDPGAPLGRATGQGQPAQNFIRYLADGTLDPAITASQSPNGAVYAVAVEPDGKIVIGGEFSTVGSSERRNVARFHADGTLADAVTSANASSGAVRSLAVLPGGGVLVGGMFEVQGQTGRNLLRTP